MERVAANGVALAVREWPGRGPAIAGVHGLTANHACWESLAAVLAPSYRLLAYDLRGRGDSDKPEKGYRLEEHARDLAGLLDHYGIRRAVVMGHSLGGDRRALRRRLPGPRGQARPRHYTILLGENPRLQEVRRSFLAG
jgi:pimeloyl-ACP methyl ester carboxylesterase